MFSEKIGNFQQYDSLASQGGFSLKASFNVSARITNHYTLFDSNSQDFGVKCALLRPFRKFDTVFLCARRSLELDGSGIS